MKFCILPLLLLLAHSPAAAQYDAILNDPDVIWAAEVDLSFWIEPDFTAPDSAYNQRNYSVPLKILNRTNEINNTANTLLAARLFDLLINEKHPAYSRPDSLRALTSYERNALINILDTITSVDPETFMEHTSVVYNCWSAESIQMLRVRQLVFYRDKSDEFEVYTAAFAPILTRNYGSEDSGAYYTFSPLWFKMPPYSRKEYQKTPNLDDPNISWAGRMSTRGNMPHLAGLHTLKDFKSPVIQQYLNRLIEDPTFDVKDGLNWKTISLADRKAMVSKTDTVVTFDPETYEEKTMVLQTNVTADDLMQLRLTEDWFWDDRKQYMTFRLYAFAPLLDRKDNEGNLRFKEPIFYRLITRK